jgi:hypothetical protein
VNIPIAGALSVCFIAGVLGFVLGAMRVNDFYEHWLRELDDNLRLLYFSDGFEYPRQSDKGRKPGWRRQARMSKRITVPPELPVAEDEAEVEVETHGSTASSLMEEPLPAETAPQPVVRPRPTKRPAETRPDMKQAAAVPPPAAPLSDDEWRAQQEAELEAWRREQESRWGSIETREGR